MMRDRDMEKEQVPGLLTGKSSPSRRRAGRRFFVYTAKASLRPPSSFKKISKTTVQRDAGKPSYGES